MLPQHIAQMMGQADYQLLRILILMRLQHSVNAFQAVYIKMRTYLHSVVFQLNLRYLQFLFILFNFQAGYLVHHLMHGFVHTDKLPFSKRLSVLRKLSLRRHFLHFLHETVQRPEKHTF